jgi:hypothetical protein
MGRWLYVAAGLKTHLNYKAAIEVEFELSIC